METLIGIDFGSVNVKVAVIRSMSDGFRTEITESRPSRGVPLRVGIQMLSNIARTIECDNKVKIAVTGTAAPVIPEEEKDSFLRLNEVVAVAAMVGAEYPNTNTIFDLGGQFSKWIALDMDESDLFSLVKDFAMNGLCAAGSGAFVDQQASRLQMDPETLGALAVEAKSGATIAGRCSVFAKSDMIHLQQKGTPVDEIAYGLCLALARTFVSSVLKGRKATAPVAFVGGGASNPGLIRAFIEVLGIVRPEITIPEHHRYSAALGAARFAACAQPIALLELHERLKRIMESREVSCEKRLSPFEDVHDEQVPGKTRCARAPAPPGESSEEHIPVYLGIDVGSVSTNVVLLQKDLTLLEEVYVPTSGQPIAALNHSFDLIKKRISKDIMVISAGATGSGRHLVARIVGADLVKNEITAQLESALHLVPGVKTIFEIGGQDSKFITTQNGHLEDFEMNKICAAGTGSFLEEQARRLGVSIKGEFSSLALRSKAPVDLGSRCTVFMDTELCRAMGRGATAQDLCAGLAYSVARNYLEKVVAGRKIGDTVVFQGGTSANAAVVKAFESLLQRHITVHPHGRVSGAIGAALLASKKKKTGLTAFLGFDACRTHTTKSFTCRSCENRCQVNRITAGDRVAHFGDVCEKYTAKDLGKAQIGGDSKETLVNPFAKRAELMASFLPKGGDHSRPRIGILSSTLSAELLPFWANLLEYLGFEPVIEGTLLRESKRGYPGIPEEVCLPLKLAASQVTSLLEAPGVRQVLLPSVQHLPVRQKKDRPNTCLYAQFFPEMLRSAFKGRLLTPQVCISNYKAHDFEGINELSNVLGIDTGQVKAAWHPAKEKQREFSMARQALGRELLSHLPKYAVVVLGKPYNLHDPRANLNLAHYLDKAGLYGIPMDLLPLDEVVLSDDWYMLPWHVNRDQIRALQLISEMDNVFPIHVSSYGCGPDAFTIKHLEGAWGKRPKLFLEFDEHKGEAGLITRIEAFADEIAEYVKQPRKWTVLVNPQERMKTAMSKSRSILLPYTSPHVHAYSGVLRDVGYNTLVLPAPERESIRLGEKVTSGRECHPFTIIAGDLVRAVNQEDIRDGDRFFIPGTRLPCLMSQYGDGFRKILGDMNERRLKIFDPHPGELNDVLGINGYLRLYEGLAIVDSLIMAGCQLRPREINRGDVDGVLTQCYVMVERRLAEKGSMRVCLADCLSLLEKVPLGPMKHVPVVGVTGDLYSRINAAGNASLFKRLESKGFTVWPSPFYAAGIDFEIPQDARRWMARRVYTKALQEASLAALLRMRSKRIVSQLPRELRERCIEPAFDELQAYAEHYVSANTNHLIRGIVAKMVDFAKRGADGVISAAGVGCMVGIAASSTISSIREDHDSLPIVSILYDGKEGPTQEVQLETFLHQVEHRYLKRVNDTPLLMSM